MTARCYRPALALVLAHEGGFIDHPKDPGGPTNKGITQRVYDAYRHMKGQSLRSVELIDSVEVEDIYKKQYWNLCRADEMPCGLDYALFDFSVNSGVSRAVRYLQRQVHVVDDGVLGMRSIAAVIDSAKVNEELLITHYYANRLAFLQSLGTFSTFGKGWTRRVNEGLKFALGMARGDPEYVMPKAVDAGKAISDADQQHVFPIHTPATLGQLAKDNDTLAMTIALDKLG